MHFGKWASPAFVMALSAGIFGFPSTARAEESAYVEESAVEVESTAEADDALRSAEPPEWEDWDSRWNRRFRQDPNWRGRGFRSCYAFCDNVREACYRGRGWRGRFGYRSGSCESVFDVCRTTCRGGFWRSE